MTGRAGGATAKYLYDGDNVVGDLVSGAFTRQYVTPFLDENLSMTVQGETPVTYFYNRDGLGSVRNLTDASQVVKNTYSTTAFGERYTKEWTETVPQRYTFQGRESGVAGAPMYYRNRMYSAGLGSEVPAGPQAKTPVRGWKCPEECKADGDKAPAGGAVVKP